jgi:DNA mismatch repair protein MSH2
VISLPTFLTAQLSLGVAPSSLAALIDYLSLLAEPSNLGTYTIYTHSLSQYMRLDSSAVRALNLTESPGNTVSLLIGRNHLGCGRVIYPPT